MMTTGQSARTDHPYLPGDLHLVYGYTPAQWSGGAVFAVTAVMWLAAVCGVYLWVSRVRPRAARDDRLTACWMALCTVTHVAIDGYYGLNYTTIPTGTGILDDLWKEYAYADSRYMIGDPAVVAVEAVTGVVLGPLCLLATLAHVHDWPYKRSVTILISLSQLYGAVIYFLSEWLDGFSHGVGPTGPGAILYFWFYFAFLNTAWVVVPGFLIYRNLTVLEGEGRATIHTKGAAAVTAHRKRW